ncbi:MAG: V-type ATP synthase subunit E family protein [Bacillota bacterium]|nr:V-type ATP synthase subunit E family protein [Bacillota bacterium]
MAGLDRLIQRIDDESRGRAEEISAAAAAYEERLLEQTRLKALEERRLRLKKAEADMLLLKERRHSRAQLKVRNEVLQAKQDIISLVLSEARQQLAAVSNEVFLRFLKDHLIKAVETGGEVLCLNSRCAARLPDDYLDQLNAVLVKQGHQGRLTLSVVDMADGFILSRSGVNMDFTFNALLDQQREDLEATLARQLFGGA